MGRVVAGRYTIEETLGRGGMAKVYRVCDTRTGRSVALKRGWARNESRAERRRALLEREFHTLAQLAHPRIIEVYDYSLDDNGPFYTMELLDGADLDKRGRVPWREACSLLCDVASSLAILHARGLIHRDVSARNVRCTTEGRAKLIDFGAMTSMGVAKDVVGTPPFMAPEVIQHQALDARADLFSLGALGYYLLTGRHAFPARKLVELRDVWRSRPAPPERIVSDIPPALNTLVLQLLALDRSARPHSAAEVMERLCSIAGIPREEHSEVSHAYLSTPILVGRDEVMIAVRRRMLPLARGDGGTLLIEGAAGSGRSRLLDAALLEAKLLGASVLRADAGDGARGDWGVARALCAQLVELWPKEANEAARLSVDVLGHVIDGLRGDASESSVWPERSLLLREVRDFVLALARGRRMVIVVDDADRIDEPSAALLAALAHKTERHGLIVAVAVDSETESPNSVSLNALRGMSLRIQLEPLAAEQTAALVRSLFGDVPNLHLCAGRLHALSLGNPRAIMELAQQLVTRGLARYEAGSWSLPDSLAHADLPSSLEASLAARLSDLSEDARSLAYLIGLAEGESLNFDSYVELTAHADQKWVFRTLDELLAARVLLAEGERYRLSQHGFAAALRRALPDARRQECHARMAELLCSSGGDVLRRTHHLLAAGRDREAIELLCSINLRVRLPPLPLLESALARAEQMSLPPRVLRALRIAVLNKAPMVLAVDTFRRCLPPVLALLDRESGLSVLRELTHLSPSERLSRALVRSQQSYMDTPESERGASPQEAVRELTQLAGACYSLATQTVDFGFFELMPDLEPLTLLSGALAIVEQMRLHAKEWLAGRRMRSSTMLVTILQRLSEPDQGGLDEMQYNRARLALIYALGLFEASIGSPRAERHAHIMEGDREMRVSAWRVRTLVHLNQGNLNEARKCSRRAELVQLQDGGDQRFLAGAAGLELISYCQAGDLLGVKNALEKVSVMAARHRGWQPLVHYGQCYLLWLRDDPQAALAELLPALALVAPGLSPYYSMLAALHVSLLRALRRDDEALSVGLGYVEIVEREQLAPDDRFVRIETAQALARAGREREAIAIMDDVIAIAERLGMAGLSLGLIYEARARVAISMSDRDGFDRYAAQCANEYSKGLNPALSQKLGRLMEDARENRASSADGPSPVKLLVADQTESEYDSIHSRIGECIDAEDRARCSLSLLLQSTDSCCGYLYGVWGRRVSVLAGLPEQPSDPAMARWVLQRVQAELDCGATETVSVDNPPIGDSTQEPLSRFTDGDGRLFQVILLIAQHEREAIVAAALAVQISAGPRSMPSGELLAGIAGQLLEHCDVDGAALNMEPVTGDGG